MATIDTIADRSTGSAIAGKAYFETSTNKFIVFNGSAWIELDSDGVGAVGYSLDANYELSTFPTLHLDASMLDGSNSVNNPADGVAVSTWGDRSGNGYDFTEATNQPVFRASTLRGQAGVEFDGVNDILKDVDFFNNADFSSSEVTMMIVAIPGRDGSGSWGVGTSDTSYNLIKTGASTTANTSYSGSEYTSNFTTSRISGQPVIDGLDLSYSRPFVYTAQIDTTYKTYVNNRPRFSSTSGFTFSVGSELSLGGADTANPFSGFILEVLLFNSVVPTSDFEDVHSYLANKYGLNMYSPLSTSSYSLDSTYSVSTAPQYHFDASASDVVLDSSYQAVPDGGDVHYWKDRANNFLAVQSTASRQPSFVSSKTIGGTSTSSPAVYFDGTGESLELWYSSWLGDYTNGNKSTVIVFEPDTDDSFELLSLVVGNSATLFGTGTSYSGINRASRLSGVGLSGFNSTGGQMIEVHSDITNNTYDLQSQGVDAITQTTPNFTATAFANTSVVGQIGGAALAPTEGTSYRFKGWIYEIMVFDKLVSSNDKSALVSYATNKYGI